MLLPGEVVGVLDCGMVQRLDEHLREEIEGLLLAVTEGDTEALADGVWRLGTTPPEVRREELSSELAEFIAEYKGQSINELQLSAALTSLIIATTSSCPRAFRCCCARSSSSKARRSF